MKITEFFKDTGGEFSSKRLALVVVLLLIVLTFLNEIYGYKLGEKSFENALHYLLIGLSFAIGGVASEQLSKITESVTSILRKNDK